MELFWEIGQEGRIADVRHTAAEATRKTASMKTEVKVLRAAIDKLILINRAMWEIIAEAENLNDEYLINKVNEIDLRDGRLDGKMITAIMECPSCGRTLSRGRYKCLYCGAEITDINPFATIDTETLDTLR